MMSRKNKIIVHYAIRSKMPAWQRCLISIKSMISVFSSIKAIMLLVVPLLTLLIGYSSNKAAVDAVAGEVRSWVYGDMEWSGLYNASAEGYVDAASMNLSGTTIQLILIARGGIIDGVIAERALCKIGAPYDYKLIRGGVSIFSEKATIDVFDFEGGYLVTYSKMTLTKDGVVMRVEPKGNKNWIDGDVIRIIKVPEVNAGDAMGGLTGFCKDEPGNMFNKMTPEKINKFRNR